DLFHQFPQPPLAGFILHAVDLFHLGGVHELRHLAAKAQGIEFKNPLAGSILCYYPTEYQLGQRCLAMVREQCG
ncbi:hypothetical protein H6B10_17560, partial [Gemmiger formicilis]|nr:hypothetical protein [Gemmiger formicilis]